MAENRARAPHAPPLFAHNLLCAGAWLAVLSPAAVLLSSRSSPHRRRSISDLRLVILVFILGQSDIFFTVSGFTTNDAPSAPTFFALCPTRHFLQICLLCYFGLFCLLILRVEGFICEELIFSWARLWYLVICAGLHLWVVLQSLGYSNYWCGSLVTFPAILWSWPNGLLHLLPLPPLLSRVTHVSSLRHLNGWLVLVQRTIWQVILIFSSTSVHTRPLLLLLLPMELLIILRVQGLFNRSPLVLFLQFYISPALYLTWFMSVELLEIWIAVSLSIPIIVFFRILCPETDYS